MAARRPSTLSLTSGLIPATIEKEVANEKEAPVKEQEDKKTPVQKIDISQELITAHFKDDVEITPRKGVGRPKDPGEFQHVSIRLTKENYKKARLESGKYGGMTAYINYLIQNDR